MSPERDFFDYCHECAFYGKCDGPEPPADDGGWGDCADSEEKPEGCRRFQERPLLNRATKK